MTVFQATLMFSNRDEDTSETPFIWARVLTQNPLDAEGNPVKNPGSIMIYGSKGVTTGDIGTFLLLSRGIDGLYDFVTPEKETEVLKALGIAKKDLKVVPLVESTSAAGVSRTEARERARTARMARRQSSRAIAATEPASAELPRAILQPE